MKVLDLFSGLNGWGAAFRDRGHSVTTLDLDSRFKSDLVADVMNLKALNGWDVVLASPPCECFSVASIGHHWTGGKRAYVPKTLEAKLAIELALHTFGLVFGAGSRGARYVIENPRGVLRRIITQKHIAVGPYDEQTKSTPVKFAGFPEPVTTWYCQWGVTQAKPTDLWTNLTGIWPTCKNGNPDHSPAPRGSKTPGSTQGYQGAATRALIPYGLSLAVCLACETDGVVRVQPKELAS